MFIFSLVEPCILRCKIGHLSWNNGVVKDGTRCYNDHTDKSVCIKGQCRVSLETKYSTSYFLFCLLPFLSLQLFFSVFYPSLPFSSPLFSSLFCYSSFSFSRPACHSFIVCLFGQLFLNPNQTVKYINMLTILISGCCM